MEFYTVDSFKWKLVMVIAVCISYTEEILRNFHRDYIQRPVQEDEEHIHWQTQVGKLVGNSVRPDVDIKIGPKLSQWLPKKCHSIFYFENVCFKSFKRQQVFWPLL